MGCGSRAGDGEKEILNMAARVQCFADLMHCWEAGDFCLAYITDDLSVAAPGISSGK